MNAKILENTAKERGYCLIRYHVTKQNFYIFKTPSEFTDRIGAKRLLADFTDEKVLKVFIRAEKTQDISNLGIDADDKKSLLRYAKRKGLDSVTIVSNWGDEQDLIVFNPNQVKSAQLSTYDDYGILIPLKDRFNPRISDMRY